MGLKAAWHRLRSSSAERDFPQISFDAWLNMMSYQGHAYGVGGGSLVQGNREIPDSYEGVCHSAYKQNGVVFACIMARLLLFSEARFQWRQFSTGRPGSLFGNPDLGLVETPWPNGTTGDLLSMMLLHADLGGNFYGVRDGATIRVLRPDWVTIVLGSKRDAKNATWQYDAEIIGYAYTPGGRGSGQDPQVFGVDQVAHWAPYKDPQARFRGMSWLTPVLDEIMADGAATTHKLKFFEKGATPNMVVTMGPQMNREEFEAWVKMFEESNVGVENAYKTLFLASGSEATVVGKDLKQIDFKVTQGHGETRIAAAARVPPIIVGLSEGLDAATYSNYGQARRAFADGTMRPLWRSAAASLETILPVPAGAHLWYDDRDISFLKEDQTDAANIAAIQASTLHTYVAAGFEPDSAIQAVLANDINKLTHTGLYSVQLQPAGTVGQGKGSVVQGIPTSTQNGQGSKPPQLPAAPSPRALLDPFIALEEAKP